MQRNALCEKTRIKELASCQYLFLLSGFCILLLGWGSGSSLAQGYHAKTQRFTIGEGLSHNHVHAVAKDQRGLIWIGTKYGLNRFDGQRFKVFTINEGLQHNTVNMLHPDGDRLWLYYFNEDLVEKGRYKVDVFDPLTEQVWPWQEYFADRLPFDWDNVAAINPVDDGVLYELFDGQLFGYREGKFMAIAKDSLAGFHLWPGSSLITLDSERGDSLRVAIYPDLGKQSDFSVSLPDLTFNGFGLFEDTNAYLLCHYSVALKYEYLKNSGKRQVDVYRIDPRGQPEHLFNLRGVDYEGVKWLPGLRLFWVKHQQADLLLNQLGDTVGMLQAPLPFKRAISAYDQGEGILWQPTDQGLAQIVISPNKFQNILFGHERDIPFRDISRVGDFLYLSGDEAVLRMDSTGRTEKVLGNGLGHFVDSAGVLWTVNGHTLYTYDCRSGKDDHRYLTHQINEIWALYKDREHGLWMGQGGLMRYDLQRGTFEPLDYRAFPDFAHAIVYHFAPYADGQQLLCTTNGLYLLDIAQRRITARYWSGGEGRYKLPADDFRHLYHDREAGKYWLATGSKGLVAWQPATGQAQNYPLLRGITNVVHGVYADGLGFLWMSTESGLVQYQMSTGRFKIYTVDDGLKTNEFNRISHFQDKDGTLYFGSINGLTRFHPKDFVSEFDRRPDAVPIIIEARQYLGSSQRETLVTQKLLQDRQLTVLPSDRYIKLWLGLTQCQWAVEASYQYRIPGYQDGWTSIIGNEILFGGLPYGRQTIEVRALLPSGQFTHQALTIPIRMVRPIYLRWWFAMLSLMSVAGFFYALYSYRLYQFKQRQKLRTEIATDLHDDVGSLLSRLSMQAEMIKYVSKERAEEILNDLINTSQSSIDTIRDIIWSIDARNDTGQDILLRMEQQLEEWLTPLDIGYALDAKRFTQTKPLDYEMRQHVFFIFKEAINNTIKHSNAQVVRVTMIYEKRFFQMAIREEAHHSDTESQRRQRMPSSKPAKAGTGIKNMHHRARQISARLEIDDRSAYRITLTKEW